MPDAQTRGSGSHMYGEVVNVEPVGDDAAFIDDRFFRKGEASGFGHNCLVNSLRQCLDVRSIDVASIRQRLMTLYPSGPAKVTDDSYLGLEHHWRDVLRLINAKLHRTLQRSVADYKVLCVNLSGRGQSVDIYGDGGERLFIAVVGGNHFIPLHAVT